MLIRFLQYTLSDLSLSLSPRNSPSLFTDKHLTGVYICFEIHIFPPSIPPLNTLFRFPYTFFLAFSSFFLSFSPFFLPNSSFRPLFLSSRFIFFPQPSNKKYFFLLTGGQIEKYTRLFIIFNSFQHILPCIIELMVYIQIYITRRKY